MNVLQLFYNNITYTRPFAVPLSTIDYNFYSNNSIFIKEVKIKYKVTHVYRVLITVVFSVKLCFFYCYFFFMKFSV